MIVAREELLRLMGLKPGFEAGNAMEMRSDDGGLRASVQWRNGEFFADVTESIEGESGNAILSLEGIFLEDEDGFDLACEDNRDEASAPDDPRSVANAYRMLTEGLIVVA